MCAAILFGKATATLGIAETQGTGSDDDFLAAVANAFPIGMFSFFVRQQLNNGQTPKSHPSQIKESRRSFLKNHAPTVSF